MSFNIRLRNARRNLICMSIDVLKIFEGEVFNGIVYFLLRIKIRRLNVLKEFIEKYKNMTEDFEPISNSRTSKGNYKNDQDAIRLLRRMAYFN